MHLRSVQTPLLVQEFIKRKQRSGDTLLFVVNGNVVGHLMQAVKPKGESVQLASRAARPSYQ